MCYAAHVLHAAIGRGQLDEAEAAFEASHVSGRRSLGSENCNMAVCTLSLCLSCINLTSQYATMQASAAAVQLWLLEALAVRELTGNCEPKQTWSY